MLEAESTPGPWWGRKDYVNKKFKLHHQELNPQPFIAQCLNQLCHRMAPCDSKVADDKIVLYVTSKCLRVIVLFIAI
jgi:hypothetical protein